MTEPAKVFRDAFRGYNKEDVNAYIQKMNFEFREREAELNRRLKEAPAAPATAPVKTADDKTGEYLAKIRELETKLAESEKRNQKYESMSSRVGQIMLDARADSEELMEKTKCEADRILTEAKAEAERSLSDAKAEAARITADALEASKATIRSASELAQKTKEDSEAAAAEKAKEAEEYAASLRETAHKSSKNMVEVSSRQARTMITFVSDRLKHLYDEQTEGYIAALGQLKAQAEHTDGKLDAFLRSFPEELNDASDISLEAVEAVIRFEGKQ